MPIRSSVVAAGLAALTLAGTVVRAADDGVFSTDPADPSYKRPVAGFIPSVLPAVLFAGIFGLLAIICWIQYLRRRLIFVLPLGLTAMAAGFGVRIVCHSQSYSVMIFSISQMLVLLSPCAFLAACYQLLGAMANTLGPETVAVNCLPIRTGLITKIFVTSDIVTFIIQAAGSGAAAAGGNVAKIGHWAALVGLAIQLVSFSVYCVLLVLFGLRVAAMYPELWRHNDGHFSWNPLRMLGGNDIDNWKVVLYTTQLACALIMIRCVFRVIEFYFGFDGKIATTEWYAYVFDAIPLALAMLLYAWFWPARYLSSSGSSARGEHKLVPLTQTRSSTWDHV